MRIDEINEKLNLGLPEDDDYDSVGGLMTVRLGAIPAISDAVTVGNARLVAVSADARRVERVRIERIDGQPLQPTQEPAPPEIEMS